jgi:hypothetical protein
MEVAVDSSDQHAPIPMTDPACQVMSKVMKAEVRQPCGATGDIKVRLQTPGGLFAFHLRTWEKPLLAWNCAQLDFAQQPFERRIQIKGPRRAEFGNAQRQLLIRPSTSDQRTCSASFRRVPEQARNRIKRNANKRTATPTRSQSKYWRTKVPPDDALFSACSLRRQQHRSLGVG